jgi:hypothetical protein
MSKTLDNQLFDITEVLSVSSGYPIPSRPCFNEMTIDYQLYNLWRAWGGGATPLLEGLLAFYKLSDISDSSGNGNTLTENNVVTFGPGKIGDAADLTLGTLTNNSLNFNGFNALSMSAWVKVNTNNVGPWAFISRYSDITGGQVFFGNYNPTDDNFLAIVLIVNGTSYEVQTTAHNAYDGDWHFVGFSFNGSEIKLYVDNQLIGTQSASGTISNSSALFMLGGSSQEIYPTDPYAGEIDAVGVWNKALNDSEWDLLYNNGNGIQLP